MPRISGATWTAERLRPVKQKGTEELLRHRIASSFCRLWIVASALTIAVSAARAETHLTFCYDPYPPFTFGTEGEPLGGLHVRLLDAVAEQIDGVTASVVLLPWKRCQAETKAGRFDGILPLLQNPERDQYLLFTRGAFEDWSSFWYSRTAFPNGLDWDGDFNELSHLTLGMLNGSFISEEMEAAFSQRHEILRARDVEGLMQLLLKDRVDLVATDYAVGRFNIIQNGWGERVQSVDRPFSRRKSGFGLSKITGADRFLDQFNRAIQTLAETGRLEEIRLSTDYLTVSE